MLLTVVVGCSAACSDTSDSAPEPLAASEFRGAAALACTSAVNHRRYELTGYVKDRETAFNALLLAMGKPAKASNEEIVAALGRLSQEARRTADELAKVRAADAADQKRWDSVVQAQRDRADALDRRAAAITGGRPADIKPGETDVGAGDALASLDLADRDCAKLST